jgi:L-aspartate oxidase
VSTGVERVEADLVVVGTGVAGLTAALGAEGMRVHLLSKSEVVSGSSPWAQGGVAAAVGREDSPELHAADTVAAGAGLVDPEVAEIVARDGVLAVQRLVEIGAEFDRGARGELALGREAAHSRRRILHAGGDATGAELVRALGRRVRRSGAVRLFDRAFAARLVVDAGRIAGVLARHAGGRWVFHASPRVALATGGLGQLYRYTTNPREATGDGLLLAAEAGARLADVEFVQFHPTALAIERDPLPLLTEALRGEGATLVDAAGERFLSDEHPDAELAPRDVVARAIWKRLAAGGHVFLDATRALGDRLPARFPQVFAFCREAGLDPRVEPLPVVPAAHYFMGGVAVDRWGGASVPGLWACGEVASTGVHGANRLASNSLLEALVFGARVAASAREQVAPPRRAATPAAPADLDPFAAAAETRREVRDLAWQSLGLVRDGGSLASAHEWLRECWSRLPAGASETRNLVAAALCVAAAAERRRESRGAHFRRDFPAPRDAWRTRQVFVARLDAREVHLRFESALEEVSA